MHPACQGKHWCLRVGAGTPRDPTVQDDSLSEAAACSVPANVSIRSEVLLGLHRPATTPAP